MSSKSVIASTVSGRGSPVTHQKERKVCWYGGDFGEPEQYLRGSKGDYVDGARVLVVRCSRRLKEVSAGLGGKILERADAHGVSQEAKRKGPLCVLWEELPFGADEPCPETIPINFKNSFAVSRARLLSRSKEFYQKLYDWVAAEPKINAYAMEFLWLALLRYDEFSANRPPPAVPVPLPPPSPLIPPPAPKSPPPPHVPGAPPPCTDCPEYTRLPIILVLSFAHPAGVIGGYGTLVERCLLLMAYKPYFLKLVFMLAENNEEPLQRLRNDHRFAGHDFVNCPGWENLHGQGSSKFATRMQAGVKGFTHRWRTYECAGDVMKKHGLQPGSEARGVLYIHMDFWLHPWKLQNLNLDIPWVFEGFLTPVTSRDIPLYKRFWELGQYDVPDCIDFKRPLNVLRLPDAWEGITWFWDRVNEAHEAANEVCAHGIGAGCPRASPEDREGRACAGWSDGFYFPRAAFTTNASCPAGSGCKSVFDTVLAPFIKREVFHETGVRTILHLLAAGLPGGDSPQGLHKIRCYGSCCNNPGSPDDIAQWMCGHPVHLQHREVQTALKALLVNQSSSQNLTMKGGLIEEWS
ncbi:hypothetical protein CYMTET_5488 [Cymbomonas tetramitiformis]|uniref:Uncharacterized protein n=1 Tax=Cymbomonas tetramitiformis TaxID=36881 RepID=A0AAE0LIT8_9CHLO|nr:hypothetical protein CYMTET_5488 [Cymbomonas tetramitiformis]